MYKLMFGKYFLNSNTILQILMHKICIKSKICHFKNKNTFEFFQVKSKYIHIGYRLTKLNNST